MFRRSERKMTAADAPPQKGLQEAGPFGAATGRGGSAFDRPAINRNPPACADGAAFFILPLFFVPAARRNRTRLLQHHPCNPGD